MTRNEELGIEILHTDCDCSDPAHSMRFMLFLSRFIRHPELGEIPKLYCDVQLNTRHRFWRRLWYGLQYAFGRKTRYSYGLWDEGTISRASALELQAMLDMFVAMTEPPPCPA